MIPGYPMEPRFGVIRINHFGFILPKSFRRLETSARFGSSTYASFSPRTKTTQCHAGPEEVRCHLIAKRASGGNSLQPRNGSSVDPHLTSRCCSNRRTWVVFPQRAASETSIPKEAAKRFTSP